MIMSLENEETECAFCVCNFWGLKLSNENETPIDKGRSMKEENFRYIKKLKIIFFCSLKFLKNCEVFL